ncbi:sensor histidine kinase [Kitasatospora sp. NPDC048540]|uniref:sensor histidine kinase n=1 Tax=unclassified Kitasatospora TaxID=2633591 RepID=UPI00068CA22A|nr:sensor histidine kinase [Kitasatospora sp. MBT63]
MATQSMTAVTGSAERFRGWLGGAVQALGRCLLLAVRAAAGPFVLLVWLGICLTRLLDDQWYTFQEVFWAFVGALLWPVALIAWSRLSARSTRRAALEWYGIKLPVSYARVPVATVDERGHWWTGRSYHRNRWSADAVLYVRTVAGDAATWRDVRAMVVNGALAVVLTLPVLGLAVFGGGVAVVAGAAALLDWQDGSGLASVPAMAVHGIQGLFALAIGLLSAPYGVRLYGRWLQRTLDRQRGGRQEQARLTRRVEHLTATRADAVGTQAAELRRIERDLHDGAQARLVAIGLTLGTIEHLLESDPAAARSLLAEARQSSAKALKELRDLVRGIHPPVLAERGLADAVRELALEAPLATEVTVSLPGRPEAPVEAAVYFCVSELMVNAAKHSGAGQVWVDILYRAGQLRVTVTDDGCGGASMERGGGLYGIERRLGTFDGVLTLDSPSGGPTTITMELPCALSSPRISTFSAKV